MGVAGLDGYSAPQRTIIANLDGCPLMGNQQSSFGGSPTSDLDAASAITAYQLSGKISGALENNPATSSFDDNPDIEQAESIADMKDVPVPFDQDGCFSEQ